MKAIKHFLIILLALVCEKTNAQDTIFFKDESPVISKITQVTESRVYYKLFSYQDGPSFIIRKSELIRIVYANGTTDNIYKGYRPKRINPNDNKNAFKYELISPAYGQATFGLERAFPKKRVSAELSFGIISSSIARIGETNPKGGFLKFSYKIFNKNVIRYMRWLDNGHTLCGLYAKPEITVGRFSANDFTYEYDSTLHYYNIKSKERIKINYCAFTLNMGHQLVLGNFFIADVYCGVGIAFDNLKNPLNVSPNSRETTSAYAHGISKSEPGTSFCFSGGFRLGFVFGDFWKRKSQ